MKTRSSMIFRAWAAEYEAAMAALNSLMAAGLKPGHDVWRRCDLAADTYWDMVEATERRLRGSLKTMVRS